MPAERSVSARRSTEDPACKRGDGRDQLGWLDRLGKVGLVSCIQGAGPIIGAGEGGDRRGRHLDARTADALHEGVAVAAGRANV